MSKEKKTIVIPEELRRYNSRETAAILQISLPTLSKMRRTGRIKSSYIGNKFMYGKEDIEAFIEESRKARKGVKRNERNEQQQI